MMKVDTARRHAALMAALLALAGTAQAETQYLPALPQLGASAGAVAPDGRSGAKAPRSAATRGHGLPVGDAAFQRAFDVLPAPADGASARDDGGDGGDGGESARARDDRNFVANDASIDVLLNALSGRLKKPVVASAKVRHKNVTGEFDLTRPRALLNQLSERMSLLWYSDGSSIYVYDNAEVKNAVVSMQHATVRNLRDFIQETRLYDARFPIRGDDLSGTFYVTGAPIYVNLVTAAAKYLDQLRTSVEKDKQVVKVVRLQNSFVNDRRYTLREKEVVIPGMATVLAQIFGKGRARVIPASAPPVAAVDPAAAVAAGAGAGVGSRAPFSLTDALPAPLAAPKAAPVAAPASPGAVAVDAADGVRAVAYPDTNSLVLVGALDKVQDMEALIRSLDVAKRQIELSLWIIDIKKSRLDQLGVSWQGTLSAGNVAIGLNSTDNVTTLDGARFLASVKALSQNGDATVVSRPVVLTQENVPATFDSNQTFYARLIGERSVQLDHVTYGTLVNVLPRLSEDASEVEMVVDVEDGNTDATTTDGQVTDKGTLPLVNRTEINTVARVPREMSLLIGGNTRDDVNRSDYRIPGLASIPLFGGLFRGHTSRHEQVVRVFLIQPKLLRPEAAWQDGQAWEPGEPSSNQTLRATVQMLQPYLDKP
jgi:type II secretory pathway component GspD/PulD (secretin)